MDFRTLSTYIYSMNEDEVFYKNYYNACKQPLALSKFLEELDLDEVESRKLIVPDIPSTLPPAMVDSYLLDISDLASIGVIKHNRYSPAIVHSHNFFELVYVYDGNCMQNISGKTFPMRTGDLCIIPPEIEHSISVFDNSIILNVIIRRDTLHTVFYSFLNTNNLLSNFFLEHIYTRKSNDYILFHTGQDSAIRESFLWMLHEYTNKDTYHFQLIATTLLMDFYLLVRNYLSSVEMPEFNNKDDVQRYALIQFIQINYKNISLKMLADKFHYSTEYTSRLIKELTGMTYSAILKRIRLERAQELLSNTNMTVAAIAENIGYDTPEHFIRQFKKQIGSTPTEFRRKNSINL